MDQAFLITVLLLGAFLLANAPFLSARLCFVGPRKDTHPWWRVGELVFAYALFIALGKGVERYVGQSSPQAWQFYAVSACLFLTMAFPGFVWRYLVRR